MAKSISEDVYTMRRYDLVGSMKQSTNPFLMDENEFTYLRNVSFDEVGSLSKDGGMTQYGADLNATGKIDLLHDYMTSAGVHNLLAVANGILYKADATPTWTAIDSDSLTADAKCSAVNRSGVCFITNSTDGLQYTTGSSLTSVSTDNGGSEVKGKYLATLNNELYLANCSSIHGVNEMVYTIGGGRTFYVATQEGADTYATTKNIVSASDTITGLVAFQGAIIFFTEGQMYLFNPENANVMTIAGIGCTDHNSIKEINGVLYWINRDGIYRFDGANTPELISLPIVNWVTNSLWRLIDGASWGSNPAVGFEGKYMVYVGDMSAIMPGDDGALSDVVLVYDTYRDVWYFLDNYPVSRMARFVNSDGNLRLMLGGKDEAAVFQKDYSYQNDGSAISMVVRSKYFNFDMPENEKVLSNFLMTYRPEAETEKYITVKVATNGSNNYEEVIGSTTDSKFELDGISGTEFQLERSSMNGIRGRTVSYEFSNADSGVNMTILGYTQQYRYMQNNMNLSV